MFDFSFDSRTNNFAIESLTFPDLSLTPHHSGATVPRIIGPKVTTGATTRNTQFTIVPL